VPGTSLRLRLLPPLLAVGLSALGCGGETCTLADCESTISVDYGSVVVSEPYHLTINPGGDTTSVVCLATGPEVEPLPEWLACDANGFQITGDFADETTITVAVVTVASQEALIANALVPLTVDQVIQPNGPDCDPTCYDRVGSTAGL